MEIKEILTDRPADQPTDQPTDRPTKVRYKISKMITANLPQANNIPETRSLRSHDKILKMIIWSIRRLYPNIPGLPRRRRRCPSPPGGNWSCCWPRLPLLPDHRQRLSRANSGYTGLDMLKNTFVRLSEYFENFPTVTKFIPYLAWNYTELLPHNLPF